MVLARLIHFFAPTRKVGFLKPSIMAMVFVLLDFVSFVIQLIGGSMAGPNSPRDQQFKSVHIYMGGIGLQQFFILIFLGIAFWFHRDMLRAERAGMLQGEKQYWRKLLFALYLSLVAISTRIIFRLIEFSSGLDSNNKIIYNEWYIYVFDAAPMIIAIAIWNAFHPGTRLQGPDAHFPQNWLVRHIARRSSIRQGVTMRRWQLSLRRTAEVVTNQQRLWETIWVEDLQGVHRRGVHREIHLHTVQHLNMILLTTTHLRNHMKHTAGKYDGGYCILKTWYSA